MTDTTVGDGEVSPAPEAARLDVAGDKRLVWLILALCLAALPFLAVRFVPAADLPQHLSQLRLFEEALGWVPRTVDFSNLELQPFTPNALVYGPLLPLHLLFDAPLAGKLGLLLNVLALVVMLHRLAWARSRSSLAALLAGLLIFSHPTYWGFLNFLSGVPIFLWLIARNLSLARAASVRPVREAIEFALCLLLLAWAHVLWAGFAALALPLALLVQRDVKRCAFYVLGGVPSMLVTLAWMRMLASRRDGGGLETLHYGPALSERFTYTWLSSSLFGGLLGWFELVATAVIVAYVALAALGALRARGAGVDFALLSVAAVLLLFGFFGPIKYLNSICLNTRFVPYGAMLLMLALPAPRLRALELGFGAFALGFSLYTTLIWTLFDQEDMSGLSESLAAAPGPKSVLGLNFRPHAETVAGNPFLQTFAYFQAERGGEINFSFAQHGSGVVAYRTPRVMRWTPNLEWDARPVTARDLALFNCALVNAPAAMHLAFQKRTGLRTSVREGYFRLYCH